MYRIVKRSLALNVHLVNISQKSILSSLFCYMLTRPDFGIPWCHRYQPMEDEYGLVSIRPATVCAEHSSAITRHCEEARPHQAHAAGSPSLA